MKTIVIPLDAHDDLISVRDKMVWSKAQRILLVWPQDGKPDLARKYDLVSLTRHATGLGAQLGLVTRDLEVRAYARELGVAVFRSTKQAQRQRWQRTRVRRRFRRRNQNPGQVRELRDALGNETPPAFLLGWSRLAIFAAGVLAVLVMGIFLLPGATVQIRPVQQEQSLSMTVIADPSLRSPSLSGSIPAEKVSTVVEVQGQIAASGETRLPDQKARGSVTFTNLTDLSLSIPAGSIVSTLAPEELRFATTQEVLVPGGSGQTAEVAVLALEGGVAGNLAPESIEALEGALGPDVVVTNPEAFSGGSDLLLPAVTQADYDRLRAQLLDTLELNAQNDLETSLSSEKTLLADTLTLVQIEAEDTLPEVGSPGDVLNLSLRAEFSAMTVTQQNLRDLATVALDAGLPEGQRAVDATLEIVQTSQPEQLSNGRVRWTVSAARKTVADLQREDLLKAVLGKRPQAARDALAALTELSTSPQIELSPSWWFWMPSLGFRIDFEVQ